MKINRLVTCPPMVPTTTAGALVLLTRMSRVIYRQVDQDQLGMTLKEFSMLNVVREAGAVTQRELGRLMSVDANMVVQLLNGLEGNGFAVRERDPEDRRRHVVRITPEGVKALVRAEKALDESTDGVLGALDPAERTQLHALLAKALGDGASSAAA